MRTVKLKAETLMAFDPDEFTYLEDNDDFAQENDWLCHLVEWASERELLDHSDFDDHQKVIDTFGNEVYIALIKRLILRM